MRTQAVEIMKNRRFDEQQCAGLVLELQKYIAEEKPYDAPCDGKDLTIRFANIHNSCPAMIMASLFKDALARLCCQSSIVFMPFSLLFGII
jgi:hypothetical protein